MIRSRIGVGRRAWSVRSSRGKLLFSKLQTRGLALQPLAQLVWQWCAVVTGQLAGCESPGERPMVDLIPATERDEQLAHALAVLQHFLV